MNDPDHSLRSWPWAQVQDCLRQYGPEIAKLAQRGDPLSQRLMARYQFAFDHPNDVEANMSLRDALTEYLQRDLTLSEREALKGEYGHLVDDAGEQTKIVVPKSLRLS